MLPRPKAQPFTFWIFLRDVALGVLLWVLLTTAVGLAREVPSESMAPTIAVGDRIWADKIGLHVSPIRRGDIVIFAPPFAADLPYVKRVIGLPGETVAVVQGRVLINGAPLAEPYLAEAPLYRYGPITVPADYYVVLGDNRNWSHDSHEWGLLSADRITARATFRVWPPGRIGSLY